MSIQFVNIGRAILSFSDWLCLRDPKKRSQQKRRTPGAPPFRVPVQPLNLRVPDPSWFVEGSALPILLLRDELPPDREPSGSRSYRTTIVTLLLPIRRIPCYHGPFL
jgi:hypothetical protein